MLWGGGGSRFDPFAIKRPLKKADLQHELEIISSLLDKCVKGISLNSDIISSSSWEIGISWICSLAGISVSCFSISVSLMISCIMLLFSKEIFPKLS